jgi:hypothetical protein
MSLIKGPLYHARLAGFYAINALAFVALVFGDGALPAGWTDITAPWKAVLPAGIGVLLVGLLNSQLSAETKAKLVFHRRTHALPGHRAFSQLGPADSRVNMERLRKTIKPWPTAPKAQNDRWYAMYRGMRDDPAIAGLHNDFLLFRDCAAAAWCALVILPPLAFWLAEHWPPIVIYTLGMIIQVLLTTRAAVDRGERLVTTVMAAAASH